jgi:hypothetical protein
MPATLVATFPLRRAHVRPSLPVLNNVDAGSPDFRCVAMVYANETALRIATLEARDIVRI